MNKTKIGRPANKRDALETVRAIDCFRIVGIEYGDNDLVLDRVSRECLAIAFARIQRGVGGEESPYRNDHLSPSSKTERRS